MEPVYVNSEFGSQTNSQTELVDTKIVPKKYSFIASFKEIVIYGPFNLLFLAIPVAFASQGANGPAGLTFVFALLAIAPLAERLGYITEQLALHTNETIGGLLNVTFGNATELIVAVVALFREELRIVQLTLLGSVLSNLLIVLGSALLVGGIYNKKQTFLAISANTNIPQLILSAMALIFTTTLVSGGNVSKAGMLSVSRCASLVLFIQYCVFLYFQVSSLVLLFVYRCMYVCIY